jgi:hypothetical protein
MFLVKAMDHEQDKERQCGRSLKEATVDDALAPLDDDAERGRTEGFGWMA